MNAHHLALSFTHDMYVDDDEPFRLMKRIEGTIWAHRDVRRARAGRFCIFIVDAERAFIEGESVFEVFDTYAQTVNFYELYTDDLEYKPAVVKLLLGGSRFAPSMLILDRLEVGPKYKGQHIGLRVLQYLQLQFSMGCGIVAMKPYPLQFEGGTPQENAAKAKFIEQGLDDFPKDFKKSLARLQRYYGRLGFKKVPGLEYMVADPYSCVPKILGDA